MLFGAEIAIAWSVTLLLYDAVAAWDSWRIALGADVVDFVAMITFRAGGAGHVIIVNGYYK